MPPAQAQTYVLNDYIKAIRSGGVAATDARDNIRSVAMVFATVKAMKTGKRIAVLDASTRSLAG